MRYELGQMVQGSLNRSLSSRDLNVGRLGAPTTCGGSWFHFSGIRKPGFTVSHPLEVGLILPLSMEHLIKVTEFSVFQNPAGAQNASSLGLCGRDIYLRS